MKKQIIQGLSAVALTMAALQPALSAGTIKVDGSSTVYPITEAVAEEFQKVNRSVKITVGISGTGGGFKKFCRGETDMANASRPITAAEMAACKVAGSDGLTVNTGSRISESGGVEYIELPIAYDALTVVINPKNDWAKSMTVEELKKIWSPEAQGKITKWNQVRPNWPDAPLKLYGAGSDSGTFDYFTEAVTGKSKSSRGDYTASEDDNVLVQGVSQDKDALGYFGFAYYAENKDKLSGVAIDAGKGAVAPSDKTVEDGTYQPLSRPIFIYINKKSLDQRPEIKQFVEFYLKNAAELVKQVQYVPLPVSAYTTAMEHVNKGRLGTVFGGKSEVGIKIDDLLKRDAAL